MIGDGSWMRHHGTDARHLGEILRVRSVSCPGVDLRIGIGPTITVAATASAQIPAPGGVLAIAPDQVADWLGPLPVQALHGIRPCQAAVLCDYGIHSVGLLAVVCPAASPPTGPKASTPFQLSRALPASAAVRHRFAHHTPDGAPVRAALLDVVVQLGLMLRRHEQAAQALTLTLKFAGGTSWDRSRRIPEPSGMTKTCAPWCTSWWPLRPATRSSDRHRPQGRGSRRCRAGCPADQPERRPRGPPGRRSGHRPHPCQVRPRRDRPCRCLPPRLVTRPCSRR
ncbi:hypothetical protein AB5J72_00460 [Streptomyces sp. CG1]|uniref:DinB/UmuC family translesion DNA polymerase n=1 Tax=Streptomyces sp. CG1 TaxID=1287523 RepID=UPI0034E23C5C